MTISITYHNFIKNINKRTTIKIHFMKVITRFAPSPTGALHIGGARTALFNYFFAKKHKGKFLLRIEDTDRKRSTKESYDAIMDGLKWLNIKYDDQPVYQYQNKEKHIKIAHELLAKGLAYETYEKIERDGEETKITTSETPAIKLKIPEGKTIVEDIIHGTVEFENKDIGDITLLRSNGDPTYMLSVVVDDINMDITHVIRGDDHLSNTPKQVLIYKAIGATPPHFAHIPLIHNMEGQKLSKRKNATDVSSYQEMGYLEDAVKSYLMQLGWSSKQNNDTLSEEEITTLFDIKDISKSPSRFDTDKLNNINLQYIKLTDDNILIQKILPIIEKLLNTPVTEEQIEDIKKALPHCKAQNNLNDIAKLLCSFIRGMQPKLTDSAKEKINANKQIVEELKVFLWDANYDNFQDEFKQFLSSKNYKFGQIGPVLRSMLIGITDSIGIADIISILGKEETLKRANLH